MNKVATTKEKPSAKEPSADVVTIGGDDVGTLEPLSREAVVRWLDGADISEDDEAGIDVLALAESILGAKDEAGVFAQDDVRKNDVLRDQTFAVLSLVWRKSTKRDDGQGRYALCRCVDADGAQFIWSTGATKVVLQLRKAQLEGWLPWTVTLNAEQTASGNTVLELVAPSPDF